MSITAGQDIIASDFVSTSSGAGDSGKVAKLGSDGRIPTAFMRFGGDGSDGALTITSGTTTLSAASAQVLVKNYTSISITGTGALGFSNAHANGTIFILKSKGDVTITSSATRAVDLRSLGAPAGTDGTSYLIKTGAGSNGSLSAGGTGGIAPFISPAVTSFASKQLVLGVGAGGGSGVSKSGTTHGGSGAGGASIITSGDGGARSGSANASGTDTGGGAGAAGGGCLYIECAGAFSCSGTLDASGGAGVDVTTTAGNGGSGGGGGGGGGSIVILYNTLTSNTGTYTVTGGAGGQQLGAPPGIGAGGGSGGTGLALVVKNTEFA